MLVSFTQKNTLSDSKTMRTIKLAQDNGYYIRMYYIGLGSVEESIECYDNENGFVEVGQYRSGEMMLRANAPAWLDELRVRYNERLNDISRDK